LGLPIIRTSVDHGTAFDISGKGIADAGSMIEAVKLAAMLAVRRSGDIRVPASFARTDVGHADDERRTSSSQSNDERR
jgi:hypothetical protein